MGVGRFLEPELLEDLADVRLDVFGLRKHVADRLVGVLPRSGRVLALAVGELLQRALLARPVEQPGDDRRVEDALALGEALSASASTAMSETRSLSR